MKRSVRTFLRENWPVALVFVGAVLAVLWFGVNFLLNLIYFNDPRHRDQDLKAWMTPRYVVMSYDLPRPLVAEILGLDHAAPDRRHLGDLAEDLGISLEDLTTRVRDAAQSYREGLE